MEDLYKIRNLCNYDEKRVNLFKKFFDEIKNEDIRDFISKKIKDLFYDKKFLGRNIIISMNAIKLALKIREQLNIVVFPYIRRIVIRGWDASGGTWKWAMYKYPVGDVGSVNSSGFCLKRKNILTLSRWDEIIAGMGQEKKENKKRIKY